MDIKLNKKKKDKIYSKTSHYKFWNIIFCVNN